MFYHIKPYYELFLFICDIFISIYITWLSRIKIYFFYKLLFALEFFFMNNEYFPMNSISNSCIILWAMLLKQKRIIKQEIQTSSIKYGGTMGVLNDPVGQCLF